MDMVIKRFEVYFVELDPALGSEINKIRPCVIISPDDANRALNTVIVAPMTSTIKNYPSRINCFVASRNGQVALDQLRAIDKQRLKNKIAVLDKSTSKKIVDLLVEMFE
jgi:mRNA interferase MazF